MFANKAEINEIIKINIFTSPGSVLWASSLGGNLDDGAGAVTLDSQDNIIRTGYCKSSNISLGNDINEIEQIINNSELSDGFVVKYDRNGSLIKVKNISSSGIDNFRTISIDSQDNIFFSRKLYIKHIKLW